MKQALLTVAAVLVLASSVARAKGDDRPTLSVVAFAAGGSSLSAEEGAELADDLATRLVETGRFRVMPREWLPATTDGDRTIPLAALREAAYQADIRYLVSASVVGLPSRALSTTKSILGTGQTILGLGGPRRIPVRCRPTTSRQRLASVDVRVLDVASGAVVRTSAVRIRLGTPGVAARLSAGCGGAATAVSPALAAHSRSDIDSLKRANADIASTLVRSRFAIE